ncbi:hypothetical protein GLYMA_04G103201v4 [Glycine max]|nr:hypothetical protein GLYMA_04G103201v4 [Glycine max]
MKASHLHQQYQQQQINTCWATTTLIIMQDNNSHHPHRPTTSYATRRNEAELQGVHPPPFSPPTPTTSDPWFKSHRNPCTPFLTFLLSPHPSSPKPYAFNNFIKDFSYITTASMFLLIITPLITNYFPIYLYPISPHHRISCKIFTLFPHSTPLLLFILLSLQGLVQSLYPPCPRLMRMIWWVHMYKVIMSMWFLRACF